MRVLGSGVSRRCHCRSGGCENRRGLRAAGVDAETALGGSHNFNFDPQVIGGQNSLHSIGPFDEADAVGLQNLVDSQVEKLLDVSQSIRVAMVDREYAFVLLDQNEGWTVHEPSVSAERDCDRLHETSLPGSQR